MAISRPDYGNVMGAIVDADGPVYRRMLRHISFGAQRGLGLNLTIDQKLGSAYVDQRQRGFGRLRFSDFVEEEFRHDYARNSVDRSRMIMSLALATVLVSMGLKLGDVNASLFMIFFDVFVLFPALAATLFVSALSHRHRLYHQLLALSALLIGLVISSVVTRASLSDMPYYFGAFLSWIFITWLILGLPFRHAAVPALTLSAIYIWGMFKWNFNAGEVIFETAMVIVVNAIGAFCCYQLEYAVRRSFIESKVLGQLAEQDGLTGLNNRRSFDQYIDRIWRQANREQSQLTIMLIDIDHFKAFNDLYGHQAGDDALKRVAAMIYASAQRPLDFVARYGGEEFALILYGPVSEYGREAPEEIRESVLALKIPHHSSSTGQYLTVSVGVAIVMPGGERSMAGAIQMADEALYQAKEEGRNRVVIKESPHTHIQTGRFRAANEPAG